MFSGTFVSDTDGTFEVILSLMGNPYDGHTLPEQLDHIMRLSGMMVKHVVVDRGYRGRKWIDDTKVEIPGAGKPTDSYYQKQKARKKVSSQGRY